MPLVPMDKVLAHLKADTADDVSIYYDAAEEAAIDFLDRNVYEDEATLADAVLANEAGDDPIVVTPSIQAAILLITGHLYRNREEVVTGQGAAAVQIPMGAQSLLRPKRVGMGV